MLWSSSMRSCFTNAYYYTAILLFLKASRFFSICFCLALSGAAATTFASSSFIWDFRWISCSSRLYREVKKIIIKGKLHRPSWSIVFWLKFTKTFRQHGFFFFFKAVERSEILSEVCVFWLTWMLAVYFSNVFFMSLSSCLCLCTLSSSCCFLCCQPCSCATFSFNAFSILSS